MVFQTASGKSSTRRIYLPQVDEEMGASRLESLEGKRPRGGEMALVVEDDKDLRSLIAQGLKTTRL